MPSILRFDGGSISLDMGGLLVGTKKMIMVGVLNSAI